MASSTEDLQSQRNHTWKPCGLRAQREETLPLKCFHAYWEKTILMCLCYTHKPGSELYPEVAKSVTRFRMVKLQDYSEGDHLLSSPSPIPKEIHHAPASSHAQHPLSALVRS